MQEKKKLVSKKHQVFRLSFDARICYDEKVVEQKLDYIHQNPVKGKWALGKISHCILIQALAFMNQVSMTTWFLLSIIKISVN